MSNFELIDRRTGSTTRFPDAPLFLAESGTKAEEFARAVVESGAVPATGWNADDSAWNEDRSSDRSNLGTGRYDVHSFKLKHDIDVLRFPCLEDALAWFCSALHSVAANPSLEKVLSKVFASDSWSRLKRLGVIDDDNGFVKTDDSSLWNSALPRVSTVKAMDTFIEHAARATKSDAKIADVTLPSPSGDGQRFTVDGMLTMGGVVAKVHDVKEVILFHPQRDLDPQDVEERHIGDSVLRAMKGYFDFWN